MINANIHFSEAHIHEFGEWQVSADATCITDGLKVRTCSCGQEETEIIPATGHSFVYTNSGATQVVTCENCDYLVATGKCGTNATWEYVASTKTLTISGTGAMSEYSCSSYNGSYVTTAPWRPYYNDIKTVIINKGITNVSGYAFFGCEEITKISIPGTVTSMGVAALEECNKITSITIPVSLTSVGVYTFYNCTGIKNVYYLGTEADRSGITFATGNNRLTNAAWHYMEAPTDVMSENIGFMNDSIENIAFSEENKYEINFVSAKDITDTKMIELDVYVNGAGFDTGIAIFDSLGNSALYNFTGLKTGWNHLAVRVSDLIEHKDNTSDVNLSNITKCVLSGSEGEEAIIANLYAADYVEGDANRDGEFNLKDIVRAKKMAAGDTEDGNKLAVSGEDYEINAVDLTNLIHSIIDSLFV